MGYNRVSVGSKSRDVTIVSGIFIALAPWWKYTGSKTRYFSRLVNCVTSWANGSGNRLHMCNIQSDRSRLLWTTIPARG